MRKVIFSVLLVFLISVYIYGQSDNSEKLYKTKYPVINFHHHIQYGGKFTAKEVFEYELKAMTAAGIEATSNLNSGYGEVFEEWAKVKQEYKDKLILFVNIDYGIDRSADEGPHVGEKLSDVKRYIRDFTSLRADFERSQVTVYIDGGKFRIFNTPNGCDFELI